MQSQFPILFFFVIISSMNLPRNLIEADWFRTAATLNPVSYMIEGLRSLIIEGWDAQALALGFGIAGLTVGVRDGARGPGAAQADGADMSRGNSMTVALALARRQMTILLKNPSLFLPPMLFPLMNFMAFAGGLSRLRHVPGFNFPTGYTSFVFVFVLLQSAAFGGVFTGFGIARDFERGFARRLLIASKHRSGIVWGYALASLFRWSTVAVLLTIVGLIAHMHIAGNGIDLFGLYALAVIVNVTGLLWACGVAMRFRSVQAGPLMQTPIFVILFLSPVYVPLALLQGWIHAVAKLNPTTYILTSGRGFISGEPIDVALGFAIALGSCGALAVWALRGLRRAEQVV